MKSLRSKSKSQDKAGSVLIIVLWIAFGLVSLALYFANSMATEMRASDNQLASVQAEQAIEGAAIYVSNILMNLNIPNTLPSPERYKAEGVKVGEGMFWLIGRDTNDMDSARRADKPTFGLMDEAAKINLNGPTNISLTNLEQYMPALMQNPNVIIAMSDWQTTNTQASSGGAKAETYSAQNPPYLCKLTNYETIDELRHVYGMTLDLLYGEDCNLNGILDPNENDGTQLSPADNQDGKLDSGILEYVTVYTHEGTNVGVATTTMTNRFQIAGAADTDIQSFLGSNGLSGQAAKIVANFPTGSEPTSVLDFYVRSQMQETDFRNIEPFLMNSNTVGSNIVGLININTAPLQVLACIPGIGYNNAQTVIAYRQANGNRLNSVAWLKDALGNNTQSLQLAGPWITSRTYQYMADIAAVGHHGRGYRRVRFVFDVSSGLPLVVHRQDLTHLGWALGKKIHDDLLTQK